MQGYNKLRLEYTAAMGTAGIWVRFSKYHSNLSLVSNPNDGK